MKPNRRIRRRAGGWFLPWILLATAAGVAGSEPATSAGADQADLDALAVWSREQYESGAHEDAVRRLEEFSVHHGDLPENLRASLALHYDALGRCAESAREFASVRTPTSAKVYHLLRDGDLGIAAQVAAAALEREPGSAVSHNNFGVARLHAGEAGVARAAFLRALELDPGLAPAMYNLALVETHYRFDLAAGHDWLAAYHTTGAIETPAEPLATFTWDDAPGAREPSRRGARDTGGPRSGHCP